MRIFLYEFVTGGGWYHVDPIEPATGSLLIEGRAMLLAAAQDFAALPGAQVVVLHDQRLPPLPLSVSIRQRGVTTGDQELDALEEEAEAADVVLLIAPETESRLSDRTMIVEKLCGRLLTHCFEIVDVTSDKIETAELLREAGVATPRSWFMSPADELPPESDYPLVYKPYDGCGSLGVQLVRSPRQPIDWSAAREGHLIAQPFYPGLAASVAILRGRPGIFPLLACVQNLSQDGRFTYLGGSAPLPIEMDQRAKSLACRAVQALGYCNGCFGVDLILGEAEDGSQDYVIEINPRLTTSYVGLRALSKTNLAQAMLDVAEGREPQLAWKPGRVSWTADGVVEYFEA